ncbi:short chain dehydrogenase reductase [Xylaria longipes]|nr:short chain dehydrogenase reductase [Xylaria longipes]
MPSLHITKDDVPNLDGKIAVVTGAATGIGFAAARILAAKGATVHILDIKPQKESELRDEIQARFPNLHYHKCDIASWTELRDAFESVGVVDIAIANAGVSDEQHASYFDDKFDADGHLAQPTWGILDVNYRAVLDFVKLAWSSMRRNGIEGSIVITASVSSYMTEQALPVYSSTKAALVALVRALRSIIINDNITINAVAPCGTDTPSMVPEFLKSMNDLGLPVSDSETVGLALVYSATAHQDRIVDLYGKDQQEDLWKKGRWNGRCILTLGDTYTEIEEPTADLKPFWFGRDNVKLVRRQQAATDFR